MKRKWIMKVWLLLLLILLLICTACNAESDSPATQTVMDRSEEDGTLNGTDISGDAETPDSTDISGSTETSNETISSDREEPEIPLSPRLEFICGSYFKAGDFRYRLLITPGSPDQQNTLQFTFQTRDLESDYKNWSNVMMTLQELTLSYEDTGSSLQLEDKYPLSFNLDGSITLEDSTEAAGTYYSFEKNLIMPDAFLRPLNDTDLIGLSPDVMRLIRNEFYAVYGRPFQSEELQSYFGNQPWYRSTGQPATFDDEILGGLVKRNVEFLKRAEETYDSDSAKALESTCENLPDPPYLSLLPDKGEVFVRIDSTSEMTRDCGIYYKAQGVIGLPLTFTPRQKRELETGNALEIDVSDLMDPFEQWAEGSGTWLKKAENSQYGEYVLLHTPDENEENGFYVEALYSSDTGVYKLWHNSGDTLFQKVYEGDIYVLKGASEKYYRYFDLPQTSQNESAGKFRIMDFNEPDDTPYTGNQIVVNDKGYLKALYFYGD